MRKGERKKKGEELDKKEKVKVLLMRERERENQIGMKRIRECVEGEERKRK